MKIKKSMIQWLTELWKHLHVNSLEYHKHLISLAWWKYSGVFLGLLAPLARKNQPWSLDKIGKHGLAPFVIALVARHPLWNPKYATGYILEMKEDFRFMIDKLDQTKTLLQRRYITVFFHQIDWARDTNIYRRFCIVLSAFANLKFYLKN